MWRSEGVGELRVGEWGSGGVREWWSEGVGFLTQRREDAECAEVSRVRE